MATAALFVALGASNQPLPPLHTLDGTEMRFVATSAQTHGASTTVVATVPPGAGPPAHIHTREDEIYVVTRGRFRFNHGAKVVDAMPGTVLFLPRNENHWWRNVGNTKGELVLTIVPAGLERMFRTMSERKLQMPRDQAAIVRLGLQYGITYVRPPARTAVK